jgi:hypothetical protein
MPVLKRVLLFLAELGILVVGIVVTSAILYHFQDEESPALATAFFGILVVSVLIFVLFRRKSRKWKITVDAATFLNDRAVRREHPRRAKIMRTLRRSLLWFPLLIVAFTLFFLPATSHVVFSSRHLVPHYKFNVPLNWMIVKSPGPYTFVWVYFSNVGVARYGLTPIWFTKSLPSGATFGITDPSRSYEWYRPKTDSTGARIILIQETSFRIGEIEMKCWEYEGEFHHVSNPRISDAPRVLREVLCSTEPNGRNFNLRASFLGRRDEVLTFYQVLRTAITE